MNKRTYNTSAQKSFKTCLHLNFSAPPLFCSFLIYGATKAESSFTGVLSWLLDSLLLLLSGWGLELSFHLAV